MPRFFVTNTQIAEGFVTVTGDDARHISRALRMAAGEHLTVCDMQRREYDCELVAFTPDTVRAKILSVKEANTEPPVPVTLFQALPKADKLDTIIQKAVECGVCRVVPFESERCVVRAKPDVEARKTERRRRIALEAAKQCGRSLVPEVSATVRFADMLEEAAACGTVFFCYEGEGTVPIGRLLREIAQKPPKSIALVIGPEGGFSVPEAAEAEKRGFFMTGLGPRILRTETASGFALACVSYVLELEA